MWYRKITDSDKLPNLRPYMCHFVTWINYSKFIEIFLTFLEHTFNTGLLYMQEFSKLRNEELLINNTAVWIICQFYICLDIF